jgi:hypothetical protein
MKRLAAVLVLCLALSACSTQDVNDYSVFKYNGGDEWDDTTLKTLGNFFPWVGEAIVYTVAIAPYLAFYLGLLWLQAGGTEVVVPPAGQSGQLPTVRAIVQ